MTDDPGFAFATMWDDVVSELNGENGNTLRPLTPQQRAWLKLVQPLTIVEGFALLSVPSSFVQNEIERHLRSQITDALSRRLGQRVELGVRIAPAEADNDTSFPGSLPSGAGAGRPEPPSTDYSGLPETENDADEVDEDGEALASAHESWPSYFIDRRPENTDSTEGTSLNRRYTFDTFVIGASNRFAHAAALAIAEAPARAYNPLFIWGESGLGKTHLLHAAGNYAQRLFPGMRVKYVSTEEFTNDFINSLRDDRKVAFKRSYRDIDVLLVDDIQFIEGKEGIQEEFFHTFNTLHNANKQIVISSDRPPKQLATLEDRLRTRFEWGLITDVQPPEFETRIAILRKKAQMDRLDVPDDVLELIASSIERNIRELEGALIRVTAFASLNKTPIDQVARRHRVARPHRRREHHADQRGHHHGRDGRVLRHHRGGTARARQDPRPGTVTPDCDVPLPRADRPVPAQDRSGLRSRPHNRDVRRTQDPSARWPNGARSSTTSRNSPRGSGSAPSAELRSLGSVGEESLKKTSGTATSPVTRVDCVRGCAVPADDITISCQARAQLRSIHRYRRRSAQASTVGAHLCRRPGLRQHPVIPRLHMTYY